MPRSCTRAESRTCILGRGASMRARRASRLALCAAFVCAGCGQLGFERLDAGPLDAGPRDASPTDASADAGSDAATSGLFVTPLARTDLNTTSDEVDPSLTPDELEIFFVSTRGGDFEVYTSRRAATAADWDMPTRVMEISDPSVETDPEISADGLHLFFTSTRGGNNDIWET